MTLLWCPNCNEIDFLWYMDEDISEYTQWHCRICNYEAQEDESFERRCNKCNETTELKLFDKSKTYWYCDVCKEIRIEDDS